MKQLIDKRFFGRNTQKGIERYLSTVGIEKPYEFIPGPTRKEVYVVSGDDIPVKYEDSVPPQGPKIDDGTEEMLDLISEVGGIPKYVAGLLINAGFDTVTSVREADDEDLIAIKGISNRRVKAIRALIAH